MVPSVVRGDIPHTMSAQLGTANAGESVARGIMTVNPAPGAPGEFRVGQVLSTSFSVLFGNFFTFVFLSALASIPGLLLQADRFGWPFGSLHFVESLGSFGTILIYAVQIVLNSLATAVVLFAAFQEMLDRKPSIGGSLAVGFSRFLPVVGASLCMGIAIGLASLLLVIPGLIVATMFYVGLPVCVVERLGPIACLSRSSELTKGYRWKIFGLWLLLVLLIAISSGVLGFLLVAVGNVWALVIGLFVWETLCRAIQSVATVVTYRDLRVAKEGIDTQRIASVFD